MEILQHSMLSVILHLLHDFWKFQMFLGCLPSFFCNQDLWSWIVAKLHHSMPSVILHLLHKFKFSVFFCLGSCLVAQESHIYSIPMLHCSTKEAYYQHVTWNQHLRCRPYHVECTGSLLTSEVKRHRARLVLGWGTAWEDLRVLTAFT